MREGGANSFFRFTLGFTTFIALSFCLTYAVSTIALKKEKEKQVGAAFQVFLGTETAHTRWFEVWK